MVAGWGVGVATGQGVAGNCNASNARGRQNQGLAEVEIGVRGKGSVKEGEIGDVKTRCRQRQQKQGEQS